MNIAILNDSFFTSAHIKRLRKLGNLAIYSTTNTPKLAKERLKNIDIALVDAFLTSYNKEILEQTESLKLLVLNTTAYSMVDTQTAKRKGILVANIPEFATDAVAELTIALLFAVLRRIPQGDKRVRSHPVDDLDPATSQGEKFIGYSVFGKTMGIIGLGKIGLQVAKLARGLGMNVIAYNRTPKDVPGIRLVSLQEVLQKSDTISLNLASSKELENFIGEKELSQMKSSAVLINTSRPEIVNTDALYNVLKNHRIFGAAVDVVSAHKNHPILSLDTIVFTPHIGAFTYESFHQNLPETIITTVEAFVAGKPIHIVNL